MGGIGAFLVNMFENIDPAVCTMDFVMYNSEKSSDFTQKIERMGGRVTCFSAFLNLKNIGKIAGEFRSYLEKQETYNIVHVHTPSLGPFVLPAAKKRGIAVRAVHSHNIKYADSWKKKLRNRFLILLGRPYINLRLACSQEAGDFLFGNKHFAIVMNGINIPRYEYNEKVRGQVRKNEKEVIIGSIGNFLHTKNHSFLIDVMEIIMQKSEHYKLWLVGEGPLRDSIERKVSRLGLEKHVRFLGRSNEVEHILQGMDIFVLPSFYEGLGIVTIEAQAADLPCYISDRCPDLVKVLPSLEMLPLGDPGLWAEKIWKTEVRHRESRLRELSEAGFDSKSSAQKLVSIYERSLSELACGSTMD